MSLPLRVALSGVVLAVAFAPAAGAAAPKKQARLSLRSVGSAPASVQAGSSFNLTARVANARNRRAASGRLTLTLRPSSGAKQRLDGINVKRLKGGTVRTLRMTVLVSARTPASTYSLVACVRRGSGEDRASCKTVRRITITVPAATSSPAPIPAPAPAPAPAPDSRTISEKLRSAITAEGMLIHLRALQGVADSNGGNRASGLQGYGGTTQYLLTALRAAGYQPTVQTFTFPFFRQLEDSVSRAPHQTRRPTPRATSLLHDVVLRLGGHDGAGARSRHQYCPGQPCQHEWLRGR